MARGILSFCPRAALLHPRRATSGRNFAKASQGLKPGALVQSNVIFSRSCSVGSVCHMVSLGPKLGFCRDFKQAIIEPLTRLYMKYRTAVYPRCKDCRIIVRYGRLWRLCRVRRHKLRQPGITTFKKRMNKYGGWAQSNVAPGR
ncbi:unnamed protein product [Effrenium voratum]|uniref:Ribosomal protein n=1 Tax=Effrenium voratum TaxID=2562239 RepID=A0AA36HW41_9DINO|nr:unnamed protein product [Effrenium voratum]